MAAGWFSDNQHSSVEQCQHLLSDGAAIAALNHATGPSGGCFGQIRAGGAAGLTIKK